MVQASNRFLDSCILLVARYGRAIQSCHPAPFGSTSRSRSSIAFSRASGVPIGRTGWTAARGSMAADWNYMRELTAYWTSNLDWRQAEAKLNAFPQFKARVDGS